MVDKLTLIVEIRDPEVAKYRLREFVKDALTTWGGQLDPVDPLFMSLKVIRVKIETARSEEEEADIMIISGYSYHRTCRICGAGFTAHTAFAELGLDDTVCTRCEKDEDKRINRELWEAEKASGDICSV